MPTEAMAALLSERGAQIEHTEPFAPIERIESWLTQAGFIEVRVTPQPESRELVASWAPGRGIENFVAAAKVEARKPGGGKTGRG